MASKIGEAFISLEIKGQEKVKKAFRSVDQSAKRSTRSVGNATQQLGKLNNRFKGLSDRVDKNVEGFDRFIGSIGKIGGVAGITIFAAFKIGRALFDLQERFTGGAQEAEKFAEAIRLEGAETRAQKLRDRVNELNSSLGGLAGAQNIVIRNFDSLLIEGKGFGNLQAQAEILEKELATVNKQLKAQQRQRRELQEVADKQAASQFFAIRAQREQLRLEQQIASASSEQEKIEATIELERLRERADLEQLRRDEEIARANFRANEINRTELEQDLAILEERKRLRQEQAEAAIADARRQAEAERRTTEQVERRGRAREEELSIIQRTAQQILEINRIQSQTRDILEDIRNTRADDGSAQTLRTIQQEVKRLRASIDNG